MAHFEFGGKQFYIDGRLKEQFDEKIIPDLKKKDMDVVFLVDGRERSGKSVFTMIHAAYIASQLGTKFDLSNICLTTTEFRKRLLDSEKREVIIYDEAHRGMASSRALSEINNILKDLMMEMGQKNLCVFIVLPSFFLLDKYAALFRSRGLFHIYMKNRQRGFWVYFNEKNKAKLYMKGKQLLNYNCMRWPRFRGRFLNQYTVDEDAYRKKKLVAFRTSRRLTRAEHAIEQRNLFLYLLYRFAKDRYGWNTDKLINEYLKKYDIGIKRRMIYNILREYKEKDKEGVLKPENLGEN